MPLPPIKIADAVQKAAYDDLAKGAMKQFGDAIAVMVGRVLDPHRKSAEELALDWQRGEEASENRRRLAAEALDQLPFERRIFPAPQIAGPILRASEFELPETPIWKMWAQLLSRACDRTRVHEAHPAFPAIVSSLAPDEALMLTNIVQRGPSAFPYGWHRLWTQLPDSSQMCSGRVFDDLPPSDITDPSMLDFYIAHLEQLSLIEMVDTFSQPTEPPVMGKIDPANHFSYRLTKIGSTFYRAVTEPKSLK